MPWYARDSAAPSDANDPTVVVELGAAVHGSFGQLQLVDLLTLLHGKAGRIAGETYAGNFIAWTGITTPS
jgi:hypothetical protein